jgi:hypothetical protein
MRADPAIPELEIIAAARRAVRLRLHFLSWTLLLLPIAAVATVLVVFRPQLSARDWVDVALGFIIRYGAVAGTAGLCAKLSFRATKSNRAGNLVFCGNLILLAAAVSAFAPLTVPAERRSNVLGRTLTALHAARPQLPIVMNVEGDLRRDLDATLDVIRRQIADASEPEARILQAFLRLAESRADTIANHRAAYRAFVQAGGLDPRTLKTQRDIEERQRLLHQLRCAELARSVQETPEGVRRCLVASGAQVDRVEHDLGRFEALLNDRVLAELLDDVRGVKAVISMLSDLGLALGQWQYDEAQDRLVSNQPRLDEVYQAAKLHLPRAGLLPHGLYGALIPPQ